MNIYLKKRKQSVFTNYKTVRATISLNNINRQPTINAWHEAMEEGSWENNWIEQATEMRLEFNQVNQTVSKQNKLILKWWEN